MKRYCTHLAWGCTPNVANRLNLKKPPAQPSLWEAWRPNLMYIRQCGKLRRSSSSQVMRTSARGGTWIQHHPLQVSWSCLQLFLWVWSVVASRASSKRAYSRCPVLHKLLQVFVRRGEKARVKVLLQVSVLFWVWCCIPWVGGRQGCRSCAAGRPPRFIPQTAVSGWGWCWPRLVPSLRSFQLVFQCLPKSPPAVIQYKTKYTKAKLLYVSLKSKRSRRLRVWCGGDNSHNFFLQNNTRHYIPKWYWSSAFMSHGNNLNIFLAIFKVIFNFYCYGAL